MANRPENGSRTDALKRLRLKLTAIISRTGSQHMSLSTVSAVIGILIAVITAPFWWCLAIVSVLVVLSVRLCWSRFPAATRFPTTSRSLWALLTIGLAIAILWVPIRSKYVEDYPPRSAVYIVPGFWSPSPIPRWFMMIRHCGPTPLYNVKINFFDSGQRRDMIKRQTLSVQNLEESEINLQYQEIDPTLDTAMFPWTPLNPGEESYIAKVVSRDAVYDESLDIDQAAGKWSYRITVTDVTTATSIKVIDCRDAGFRPSPTTKNLPACFPHYVVGEHRNACD